MKKEKIKDILITVVEGLALFLFFCLDYPKIFGL